MGRSWRSGRGLLTLALLILSLALMVTHVALDAGDSQEAPRGIIDGAIFAAVAATLVGTWQRRSPGPGE